MSPNEWFITIVGHKCIAMTKTTLACNDKDDLGIKSYDRFLAKAAPRALQAETTEPLLTGNWQLKDY